jgi:hypothetical protein
VASTPPQTSRKSSLSTKTPSIAPFARSPLKAFLKKPLPRSFRNTPLSDPLRSDVPRSVRALFIFSGSEFCARPFQEFSYSLQTGIASRHMLSGMDSFQYLAQNPELAKIFDDAMTAFTNLIGPSVATSYDFSSWENLTGVGGGNGILLSHILKAHKVFAASWPMSRMFSNAPASVAIRRPRVARQHATLQFLRSHSLWHARLSHEKRHPRLG